MQVDLLSGTVPKNDRWYLLIVSLLGSGAAAACLSLVPGHVLDFDTASATTQLNDALAERIEAVAPELVSHLLSSCMDA